MSMKFDRVPPPVSCSAIEAGSVGCPLAFARSRSVSRSMADAKARKVTVLSSCVSFSAPTASATSTAPARTAMIAMWAADEIDAHALSTLTIGLPRSPVGSSATWPRMVSWPVIKPLTALPKKIIPTSCGGMRASSSACWTASVARDRTLRSGKRPNGVIPVPATTAWLMRRLLSCSPLTGIPAAEHERLDQVDHLLHRRAAVATVLGDLVDEGEDAGHERAALGLAQLGADLAQHRGPGVPEAAATT